MISRSSKPVQTMQRLKTRARLGSATGLNARSQPSGARWDNARGLIGADSPWRWATGAVGSRSPLNVRSTLVAAGTPLSALPGPMMAKPAAVRRQPNRQDATIRFGCWPR